MTTRKGKDVYLIDGVEVTKKAFDDAFPDKPIGEFGGQASGAWPLYSEALAVHPDQLKEAHENAAAKGVQTDFTPDGRAIFRDRDHRKRYMKAYGVHDNSGGYGDG